MTTEAVVTGTHLSTSSTTASQLKVKGESCPVDRDAGFCSGGEDDESEESNTINSDDSGIKTTSKQTKNKRKCAEPLKISVKAEEGPLKKRIRFESEPEPETWSPGSPASPFRPWSLPGRAREHAPVDEPPSPARYPDLQEQPLSLVTVPRSVPSTSTSSAAPIAPRRDKKRISVPDIAIRLSSDIFSSHKPPSSPPRVPPHPAVRPLTVEEINAAHSSRHLPSFNVESLLTSQQVNHESTASIASTSSAGRAKSGASGSKEQRNYKNMTRERRIEANARERTRVHTISAAFDTLRRSIPSYSHNQKLSKLSVLRIACSYILTLSRLSGDDYSADRSEPSLEECIEAVTRTIQTEGKLRKKKDDV